jgi:tetratricopeptide (TPR) repeat protein
MSKKLFGVSTIYLILGLVFIALIGIRTISTPEIWTHLAQGRTNAPISYLEAETSVNTTHLYDKITHTLWNTGGAPLLIIVNVLCLLAAFILLLRVSKKWGSPLSQGFALLICGELIFQGLDVGPQTTMMLFIALFIYFLTTHQKTVVLFGALIPIQILWTNMHGSFLFGPLIVLLAAIQAGQNAKGPKRNRQQEPQAGLLGILTATLLIATLVNPYAAKLHGQVIANISSPNPIYWSSLFLDYFQVPDQKPLIFFVLILGAGGLITLKKKLPIMLTTLAILGAFLVWTMPQTVQLFVVLSFPFIVLSLTSISEYLEHSLGTVLGKQKKLLAPATQVVFILLIVLATIPVVSNCAYIQSGSASTFGLGVQEELYPAGTESIIGHPAFPDKVLNLAADGGYLAWKYPTRKVLIDYRSGRYDREFLTDLNSMMFGNTKAYDTIYEAHRPEAIIINTLVPSSAQGLVTLLSRGFWKLAYFDGTTAILLLNKDEFEPIFNDTSIQAAGLARLEAAHGAYADKVSQGCRAGNPAELIGSGKIFLALNRPKESEAIFSLLLQGNSKIPGAWIGLGNSQLLLKKFDAAAESLDTATQLAPNSLMAWASYANACKYAGKTAEQEHAIKRVKQLAAQSVSEEVEKEEEALEIPEEKNPSLRDIEIPE